jgi:polyhydroxybutyrate depolymerase
MREHSLERTRFHRLLRVGCLTLAVLIVGVGVLAWIINPSSLSGGGGLFPNKEEDRITCTTPQQRTGDSEERITSVGLERRFLIHLAPSYGRHAQPLLVAYHGYDETAEGVRNASHMNTIADKNGFIVVYPQASESPSSWNAGVGAYGPTADTDDVQFTRDLLSYIEKNYCVDTQRVYLAGFSLGGGMVYRLACGLSDRITAIATAAGAYYPFPEECQPKRPMAVMEIHGQADPYAPYDGNPDRLMASVQDYLNGWLERDGCDKTSKQFFQEGDVTGIEWTNCSGGVSVRHYQVSDGKHSWLVVPGAHPVIDSSTVMWEFLSKFSLPAPKTPTSVATAKQ